MLTHDLSTEAPPHVLEGLKAVNRTAELVPLGLREITVTTPSGLLVPTWAPVWLLGTVRPNESTWNERKRVPVRGGDSERMWRLVCQGFRPYGDISFIPGQDLNSEVVHAFRMREWLADHEFDKQLARRLSESDDTPHLLLNQQKMRDLAEAEGKDVWRFVFKGRRSVTMPSAAPWNN